MKAQVLTDMPDNELNDLLVTEKERLVKMKMSHAVSPWRIHCKSSLQEK